ncbi:MAG: ATP-binding protein, partial [Infirmifilum sp.]
MRRVRLRFADTTVEFTDRELALKRIEDWARRSTYPVQVIYGPEGCGKTAWLLQSTELLRELGFEVIYVNPINRLAIAEFGVRDLREEFLKLVKEAISQSAIARIA